MAPLTLLFIALLLLPWTFDNHRQPTRLPPGWLRRTPTATLVPGQPTPTFTPTVTPTRTPTPTAQPTNTPTPSPCPATLQMLIDGAPAGSTLVLPACIYRETVNITKPLTLDGQHHAEIRGSDVWTTWAPNGNGWLSAQSYPDVGTDFTAGTAPCDQGGPCYLDYFRAWNLEQVFIDGAPQTHVQSAPGPGQFTLDGARRVQIGSNPAGHVVEVSTRKRWVNTLTDNITLTNLTFHHAATGAFESAVSNDCHQGFTIQNSTLTDAHGSMLGSGCAGVTSTKILGNTLVRAGDVALGGYQGSGTVIQGNTFLQNGGGGWEPNWQAGAVKIVSQVGALIDGNVVDGSGTGGVGMGLWCDIHCSNITYSNNKVHDVPDVAIHFEISNGCTIYNNAVWNSGQRNASPSIYVSSSGGCEVKNNVVYGAVGNALFMGFWNRPDIGTFDTNYFHDNDVIMTVDNGYKALGFEIDPAIGSLNAGQHGSNNGFWYPVAEGGLNRYSWTPTYTTSLATFNSTPGGGGNSFYLTTTQKDQILTTAGIPH